MPFKFCRIYFLLCQDGPIAGNTKVQVGGGKHKKTYIFLQIIMGEYIPSIFAKIVGSIRWNNAPQPAKSNTGPTHLKVKFSWRPNISMWGVYPEAMACNVGGLCSDFNLGERIWRLSPRRPNLNVYFEIRPLALYFQIRSPKLKSEHNPPTLQAIASG